MIKTNPKRVLVACIGNTERSPLLAALIKEWVTGNDYEVHVESVGVGESALLGGCTSDEAITAAKRMNIDLSKHERRHVSAVDPKSFDAIVCADASVVNAMVDLKVPKNKLWPAGIDGDKNLWPVHCLEDYEEKIVPEVLKAAYKFVRRCYE